MLSNKEISIKLIEVPLVFSDSVINTDGAANFDDVAESPKFAFYVIPVTAGIYSFQRVMDSRASLPGLDPGPGMTI
jgi:hypothetical protein